MRHFSLKIALLVTLSLPLLFSSFATAKKNEAPQSRLLGSCASSSGGGTTQSVEFDDSISKGGGGATDYRLPRKIASGGPGAEIVVRGSDLEKKSSPLQDDFFKNPKKNNEPVKKRVKGDALRSNRSSAP